MATYDPVSDFYEFISMCREMGIDESRELLTDMQVDINAVEEMVRKELGNGHYIVCTNYSRGTIEVAKVKNQEEMEKYSTDQISSYEQALRVLKNSKCNERVFKIPEEVNPVEFVNLIKEMEDVSSEILLIDYNVRSTPRTITATLLH